MQDRSVQFLHLLGNRMVLSKEKGAIGFIGCSNDSYWDEDYFWAVGAGSVSLEPTYQTTGLGAYDRLVSFKRRITCRLVFYDGSG